MSIFWVFFYSFCGLLTSISNRCVLKGPFCSWSQLRTARHRYLGQKLSALGICSHSGPCRPRFLRSRRCPRTRLPFNLRSLSLGKTWAWRFPELCWYSSFTKENAFWTPHSSATLLQLLGKNGRFAERTQAQASPLSDTFPPGFTPGGSASYGSMGDFSNVKQQFSTACYMFSRRNKNLKQFCDYRDFTYYMAF